LNYKTSNESKFCDDIVFGNANTIPSLLGVASSAAVAMAAIGMTAMVKASALTMLGPEAGLVGPEVDIIDLILGQHARHT
jgi:hypothetical protein